MCIYVVVMVMWEGKVEIKLAIVGKGKKKKFEGRNY